MSTYDELLREYKQLAKRADQRLVRLEKYSNDPHYKGITSYAYARAMRDIKSWSGQDANRFNTKAPDNKQQLQAKLADIKQFLNAPTSTKAGVTSIYKQRAKTTNERYGTNFTWQELANFYESSLAEKLDSQYGSKTMTKALGAIRRISNTPNAIEKVLNDHLKLSDDEIVADMAKDILLKNPGIIKVFSK